MDLRAKKHWLALFEDMTSVQALIEHTAADGEPVMTRGHQDLFNSPAEDEGWARADRPPRRRQTVLAIRSSGRDDIQCVTVSQASGSGGGYADGSLYAVPFAAIGEVMHGSVRSVTPLDNGLEALVTADFSGWELTFSDPVYFEDAPRFAAPLASRAQSGFSLAAIAFWLRRVSEAQRAEWGFEKGRGHVEPDRPSYPDETVFPDWQRLLGEISALDYCSFGGRPLAKITLRLGGGERDLSLTLIVAPKALLDGYDPQVGDTIWSAVWLTGHLRQNWPHRRGGLLDRR